MSCYYCGKGVIFGRSHTHHRGVAGGRWKKRAQKTARIFAPNLQPVTVMEAGQPKRVKLCTKCLKRIKKDTKEGKTPFLQLAVSSQSAS
ncbi:50S ribosomal protein L28 [Patescibacteria group bacterium]|nr:50S ribosomal protein L28 [Patescibacteria group bacterium]MCL5091975.1 50S ribosomal protein L28 [Patescibacteria group bacterium]